MNPMKKLLLFLLLPLSLTGATRVDPLMVFTDGRVANYTNLFRANSNSIVSAIGGRTVTPKLFGAVGDDSTDDTVALNAAILWGAQNKTPIVITEGRYRYSSPLLVHDNTTLISEPNGILRPNISGSDSTFTYSFLRNTNLFSGIGPTPRTTVAALATNITLRGLRFEAVAGSSTNVFGVTLIGAHNVVMEDIEIDRTFGAWAFTIYAQDLRASKLRVKNNQAIFEDGIHVLGGERLVFSDCQIQSGDDSLAIGWDASDVFSRDILFNNITVKSYRAFPIKMFAPPEMTAGVTVQEKVIFNNIVGEGGMNRNGGIFLYEQGTPRGAITNITISNVKLTVNSGAHDGVNPYGVWLLGTADVTLDNVVVQGADSYQLVVDRLKGPLAVNNSLFGQPGNTNTESVLIFDSYTNAATFTGTTVINDYYRPFRAIEADILLNGGTIRSGGVMHVGFQTATNATRTFRSSGVTYAGSSLAPVSATGTGTNLLTCIFTGNVTPTGSAITGITANNYHQFGNTGMSVYDLFSNLRVNNLVATNATLGQSTGGLAANLIGGTFGAQILTMQRDSLSQTVGFGVGTDAIIGWNVTDNVGINYMFGDASSTSWLGGAGNGGAAPRPLFVRPENASSGTDSPGASFTLQGSAGTGNNTTGGSIIFQTPDAGASGTAVQSYTTKVTIERDGDMTVSGNITSSNIRSGTGTPEGAVTAPVGTLFLRTDGGAGSTLYVKESGSGNTGWAAK